MINKIEIREDKTFENVDFAEKTLTDREFYNCIFKKCDFSKSLLQSVEFEDCQFLSCNFTMAKLNNSGFRNAQFKDCKMLGVDFTVCNKMMFSFSFDKCFLDYSIFYASKLKKTVFNSCSIKEADFSEAVLTGSKFTDCDLFNTLFSRTVLDKVDFRTARNFSIDPEFNKVKKAKFSAFNLEGLLQKYQLDVEHLDDN